MTEDENDQGTEGARAAREGMGRRFGGRPARFVPEGDTKRRDADGRDLDAILEKRRGWRREGRTLVGELRLGPDANPGDAYWCEPHKRLECTKKKNRGGERCHSTAIRGTDGCARHVGMTVKKAIAMGEARMTAWKTLGAPTVSGIVDPGPAVMGMLQMAWLRAALYADLLRKQVEKGAGQDAADGGESDEASVDGLVGHKLAAVPGTGEIYQTSEEVRALVLLEAAERDRVVKFAKVAHDMGIADQTLKLAQQWTDVVAGRVTAMLADLMLSPEQEALVPTVVTAHLSSIDMNALEA